MNTWENEDWPESRAWIRTFRGGTKHESVRIVRTIYQMTGGAPMLDLGCRSAQLTRRLDGAWVEVDPQPDTPPQAHIIDLRRAPEYFAGETFNLLIMTDVIEHLERLDALSLLRDMKPSTQGTLIFTPVGLFAPSITNGPHSHRSGWSPEEFVANDYSVWEWPSFHRFENGDIRGAFWAWKLREGTPSVFEVAERAHVKI